MLTDRIEIKPLSVNALWQGRRFKTPAYKVYEQEVFYQLPKIEIPDGHLFLWLEVGLSNKLQDLDGTAKAFIDILQKKYNFNDNRIYKIEMEKHIVKKGEEYVGFTFFELP